MNEILYEWKDKISIYVYAENMTDSLLLLLDKIPHSYTIHT